MTHRANHVVGDSLQERCSSYALEFRFSNRVHDCLDTALELSPTLRTGLVEAESIPGLLELDGGPGNLQTPLQREAVTESAYQYGGQRQEDNAAHDVESHPDEHRSGVDGEFERAGDRVEDERADRADHCEQGQGCELRSVCCKNSPRHQQHHPDNAVGREGADCHHAYFAHPGTQVVVGHHGHREPAASESRTTW